MNTNVLLFKYRNSGHLICAQRFLYGLGLNDYFLDDTAVGNEAELMANGGCERGIDSELKMLFDERHAGQFLHLHHTLGAGLVIN